VDVAKAAISQSPDAIAWLDEDLKDSHEFYDVLIEMIQAS